MLGVNHHDDNCPCNHNHDNYNDDTAANNHDEHDNDEHDNYHSAVDNLFRLYR